MNEFEPYEFMEYDTYLKKDVPTYRCWRGRCGEFGGMATWVADRNTHNHYHNEIEAGRPNPFWLYC